MQRASGCCFNEAWIGLCGKHPVPGEEYCEKHLGQECWCGAQATHNCDVAVSLVCGAPLCDDHECRSGGGMFTGSEPHSEKGQQQYQEWPSQQGL